MRIISADELKEILEKHKKWLETRYNDNPEGERANLSDANLSDANLRGANLRDANLSCANLSDANLSCANLSCANLSCANLSCANLSDANLSCANLSCANLSCANLSDANLSDANLSDANLRDANLSCANLRDANLSDANLSCANLSCANLSCANLDQKEQIRFGMILKEDLKAFKKCYSYDFDNDYCIVELVIPKGSIVFSINNGKCRTNRAKVVSIKNMYNDKDYKKAYSSYNENFTYEVGQELEIEDFNCQYNIECASGIHFFRTIEEAKNYSL